MEADSNPSPSSATYVAFFMELQMVERYYSNFRLTHPYRER